MWFRACVSSCHMYVRTVWTSSESKFSHAEEWEAEFLGLSCSQLPAVERLLFLLALLSTSYSLITDPDPDTQTINWLPASLTVEQSLKSSQRCRNTPAISAFLAQLVFPPTGSESLLVFCTFSDAFQLSLRLRGLQSWRLAGPARPSSKVWRSRVLEKQARPLNQSPESAVCGKPQPGYFSNKWASWTSPSSRRPERRREKQEEVWAGTMVITQAGWWSHHSSLHHLSSKTRWRQQRGARNVNVTAPRQEASAVDLLCSMLTVLSIE